MPSFKSRSGRNYARKSRRTSRYGKFAKPSGAVRDVYRRRNGRIASIYRPKFSNPFRKDFEMVQLKYRQVVSINPQADALAVGGADQPTYTFSFNNLNDPDVTGTIGGQPMYFDNYAQLYSKYKVSFAKVKATIVNHSVNTVTSVSNGAVGNVQPNYSYKFAIIRDIDNEVPTNMETLLMQNATNCKWRYVAPQLNGSLPSLSMKCAPHKTAGLSYNDDTLTSMVTAGPGRDVKAILCLSSADGETNPPSVRVVVEMTYYVKFFDRKVVQAAN